MWALSPPLLEESLIHWTECEAVAHYLHFKNIPAAVAEKKNHVMDAARARVMVGADNPATSAVYREMRCGSQRNPVRNLRSIKV